MERTQAATTRREDTLAGARAPEPPGSQPSSSSALDRAGDVLAMAESVLTSRASAHDAAAVTLRRLIARAQHAAAQLT